MDAPLIRYAKTADGVDIAYWTLGRGAPLVQLPGFPHSHIRMEWELPEMRRGFELVAAERTMVRYDGRGTGLSQREVDDFSLEAMLADLDAVIDALGGGPVALMGVVNSAPVAVAYAARNPGRVSELILWCPVVDCSLHLANRTLQAARKVMETDWDLYALTVAHALVGWDEPEAARRFAALVRAGLSPATAPVLVAAMHAFDATEELGRVRCPALVLHRPALPLVPAGTAERIAAAIPGARLALFEGRSSAPYVGDWRAVVRAVGDFLGIAPAGTAGQSGRRALRLLAMKGGSLSAREHEIVGLVVRGLTNRQIAEELFLAEKTVENHVGRILVKLDLPSRTRLAAYAVEHGLAGGSRPAAGSGGL